MVCGTVLGCLGIGYLLLEVGHLSLRRIDVPLGLLGGLLGHMDSGLGVGPYLLGGLDLLERAWASRLCGLVGCSSCSAAFAASARFAAATSYAALASVSFWSAAALASDAACTSASPASASAVA